MTGAAGPCRWCGRPSYLEDEDGEPAHPCCAYWIGVRGHVRCQSCDASAAYAKGKKA